MWTKLSNENPPNYKKLLVWVDNDARLASYTSDHEFIYLDQEPEPLTRPTHFILIEKPIDHIQKVCF